MPFWSLPEIEALADNYPSADVSLSKFSVALILSSLDFLSDTENWSGADFINGLTDTEKDAIEAYVSELAEAIFDGTA